MSRVKTGEIWALGEHRLYCADSTDKANIMQLLEGKEADMILTDPPYSMGMGGGGCFKKSTQNLKERLQKIINFDAYTIEFYKDLEVPTVYIFTSKALVYDYLTIFKKWNADILCWCKTNPTPFVSNSFLPDIEYMLCFTRPGKKIWNRGLKPMSIYSRFFVSSKEIGKTGIGDLHPTMKPVQLLENKIRISSYPCGVVLDPFAGSGSTMEACQRAGRACYMMEYEPVYCDTIISRWQRLTGGQAQKL